jgi:hypothetical protein
LKKEAKQQTCFESEQVSSESKQTCSEFEQTCFRSELTSFRKELTCFESKNASLDSKHISSMSKQTSFKSPLTSLEAIRAWIASLISCSIYRSNHAGSMRELSILTFCLFETDINSEQKHSPAVDRVRSQARYRSGFQIADVLRHQRCSIRYRMLPSLAGGYPSRLISVFRCGR